MESFKWREFLEECAAPGGGGAAAWKTGRMALGEPLALRGERIADLDLQSFDLSRGDLYGAAFDRCDLRGASLVSARVDDARFDHCKMDGCFIAGSVGWQLAAIDPEALAACSDAVPPRPPRGAGSSGVIFSGFGQDRAAGVTFGRGG